MPSNPVKGIELELSQLNPDKIYLENVRSILHVSATAASEVLEAAVRQGLLRRGVEVRCPDGYVAATADNGQELPETVNCWHEEDGRTQRVPLPTSELKKVTFYKLNDKSRAAVVHG
jgi:hypothetical protein